MDAVRQPLLDLVAEHRGFSADALEACLIALRVLVLGERIVGLGRRERPNREASETARDRDRGGDAETNGLSELHARGL